jgi:hypothetical protein
MSVLYNLVLKVFKNTIKSTIENALAGMMTEAINNSGGILDVFD